MEIKDKVALITGASRGIGKAITLRLAHEGAHVAINYFRSEEKARRVQEEAKSFGVQAKIYRADVSDYRMVENMVADVIRDFKRIDILVNNAGIMPEHHSILDIPIDEWRKVIDVNLTGYFNVIKAVAPYMIRNKAGKIVNIASVAGKMGGTVGPHYAASKAGIIGMTFSLAQELLKYGIAVNAVAPGPIETDLISGLPEELKERIRKRVPMGRFGRPEEVAEAVIFLIKCDYVTGEVLDVNGGYYMD